MVQLVEVAEAVAPYVAEFVGTFFVIFTIGCNAISGSTTWMPTSIAFAIMVTMYATAAVSGGHLNPTLSLALGLSGKMRWSRVISYCIVQVVAGLVAAYTATSMLQKTVLVDSSEGLFDVAIVELIFSTTVAFVALNCIASSRNNPKEDRNQFFALAVGFVAIAGGYCSSDVSGAFFNPAATIGYGVSSRSPWLCIITYVGCQLTASLVAAILFLMVRPEELAALGITGDGLSCGRACGALSLFGSRSRPDAVTDGTDAEVPRTDKLHWENYALQFSVRLLAEFLGTYVVVFTFVLASVTESMSEKEARSLTDSTANNPVFIKTGNSSRYTSKHYATESEEMDESSTTAWAAGAAVMSMLYALGNISGGHFNPAVTLAVLLSRRPGCSFTEGASYMLAQAGAAISAAVCVVCLHRNGNGVFNIDRVVYMGPDLENGYGWAAVACGETAFTSAVALVLMCMTTVKSQRYAKAPSTKSFQFALAVGMCYTAGSFALEGITGGHLNPAVSLGLATSNFISSGFKALSTQTTALMWFALSQALGGVIAAIFFIAVHPFEYKMDPLLVERAGADSAVQRLGAGDRDSDRRSL